MRKLEIEPALFRDRGQSPSTAGRRLRLHSSVFFVNHRFSGGNRRLEPGTEIAGAPSRLVGRIVRVELTP